MGLGFFGSYVFMDEAWQLVVPEDEPAVSEPWLAVTIHDSDIGFVGYAPSGPGSGVAYLGYTPRVYFESDDESRPVDVDREAAGLAEWSAARGGRGASLEVRRHEIRTYLATDEPVEAGDGDEDLDDADVFVEIKVARLLRVLGLPVPEDLPSAN